MENMQARINHSTDAPSEPSSEEPYIPPQPEPVRVDRPNYTPPRPHRRQPLSTAKKRSWKKPVLIVATILLVIGLGWLIVKLFGGSVDGIDTNRYQAVFLSNNTLASNVYFGKLERMSDGYYRLTHVYYLQQTKADDQNKDAGVTLTKMTTQIHGPEDALVLPREQVLYYQNMRDDSKVVQAIKQDNKN